MVLIIGILAAIALPQYQKAVGKTRAMKAYHNAQTFKREIETILLDPPGTCAIYLTGTSRTSGYGGCTDVHEPSADLASQFTDVSETESKRDGVYYGAYASPGAVTTGTVWANSSLYRFSMQRQSDGRWISVCAYNMDPSKMSLSKMLCNSFPGVSTPHPGGVF